MRTATKLALAAMVVGLLAAGCSSGAGDTTALSETTVPIASTVTTAATTTTTQAIAADASCVECHTDQATLQDLAVEPVAEEILSEGEG